MELRPGLILDHYRLIAKIGEGGMGVVWRAVDTRLDREVALKFLPAGAIPDGARLERFRREARALAKLSHPGIATLHNLEVTEETPFLVMELLAGETLRERLGRGPLPVDEALDVGARIAGALTLAHGRDIVHRDLKPDNVMLTEDGAVKVLDFGLAKVFAPTGDVAAEDAATRSLEATRAGAVLGTLGYMSPEQARGEPVDGRTDIWALGCLVFECLTGSRPFEAASVAETLAAMLEREPDWKALPAGTPDRLRGLLRRCLEKDPDRRPAGVGLVAGEMAQMRDTLRRPQAPAPSWRGPLLLIGAVVAVSAVVAALLIGPGGAPAPGTPAVGLLPTLEQVTFAPGVERFPAFSPDGRRLAFARDLGGTHALFLKDLDSGQENQITSGEHDDIQPAFTPDGGALLFVRGRQAGATLEPGDVFGTYDGGDLWRVDLTSGEESRLAEEAFNPAVSPDGTAIAVDAEWAGARRIWRLDAAGRNPVQVTAEASEGVNHVRPRWSPDGRRIVFQAIKRTVFDVEVVDLAGGDVHALTDDPVMDIHPIFAPDGRWVYFSSYRSGGINVWRVPFAGAGGPSGSLQQVTSGAGQDVDLAVAGDGRLALAILKQNADLWLLPVHPATGLADGAPREVVATTREDSRGAWSPDGQRLAFNSDRGGDMSIWVQDLAAGTARQVTRGPGGDYQPRWFPDGERLVFFSSRNGNADIYAVDVDGGEPVRLTSDPATDVNPAVSPDGRLIAFHSDRGGHQELWIMAADGSDQRPLTRVGVSGHFLAWTPDGRDILFRSPAPGGSRTMRVSPEGGQPTPTAGVRGGSHMSLSPDGRVVMDVSGHKVLWVSPLDGDEPAVAFEFDDPGVRIDYPLWSPDGTLVIFDRFRPEGGDVWLLSLPGSAQDQHVGG